MGTVALKTLAEETGGELIGASVSLTSWHWTVGMWARVICLRLSRDPRLTGMIMRRSPQRRCGGIAHSEKVGGHSAAVGGFQRYVGHRAIWIPQAPSFSGDIVAITGSAGKTTTKNLLGAAGPLGAVHATSGNQNNELESR